MMKNKQVYIIIKVSPQNDNIKVGHSDLLQQSKFVNLSIKAIW